MTVRIDPSSPIPPFEQLRAHIAASILGGYLDEGHQLPPIRQLSADLDLAPGTVARAYRELESAGLVISRGRRGTRVASLRDRPDGWDQRLTAAAQRYAERSLRTSTSRSTTPSLPSTQHWPHPVFPSDSRPEPGTRPDGIGTHDRCGAPSSANSIATLSRAKRRGWHPVRNDRRGSRGNTPVGYLDRRVSNERARSVRMRLAPNGRPDWPGSLTHQTRRPGLNTRSARAVGCWCASRPRSCPWVRW
jgi:GntR family transcriptional regulator